jgi:ubiquinone/menaquinone biosynthesis C-methylase UbiE
LVSFDRVAEIYDKTRGFPVFVMNKIVEKLICKLKGCVKVLEAGVGTGRYLKPLQDSGFEVVGIDISSKMLKKATERGTRNSLRGSVCNLPFIDNSFDATISAGMLHLIREWRIALQEIARVTTVSFVSIVHRGRSPVGKEYNKLLTEYGFELPQLGIAERELEDIVKPTKSVDVVTYKPDTEKHLAYLNQKAYSFQWHIPERMHRRIMQELKTKQFPKAYFSKIEIMMWDIEELGRFSSITQS